MLFFISINSFSQIVDIEEKEFGTPTGTYYKDINNILDDFEGTYLYTNGNTSFKIVLQKMEHSSINDRYYEDLIIGAYQYIENGITKVDVLSDLNNNYSYGRKYVIDGNYIMTGTNASCPTCGVNEKWISLKICDPVSGSSAIMYVRKLNDALGGEYIKVWFYLAIGARLETDPVRQPVSFPVFQKFTLFKQ